MSVENDLPKIMLNEGQIEQALINIIFNSIEAMELGGLLKISVLPNNHDLDDFPESIKITFKDSGTGIKNYEMTQLVKPFFTTKTKGTGLGLTIVKRIMDNHKGNFVLQNANGKGTEAIITLPLDKK